MDIEPNATDRRAGQSAADMLAEAGRALYGPEFGQRLANDLGIDRESVRRWLTGKTPFNYEHAVIAELLVLVEARIIALQKIQEILARHV